MRGCASTGPLLLTQRTSINGELRRRTQQYGYMFSFQQRTIIGRGAPLPAYCGTLLERVRTATADGGLHEVLDKVPHLDLLIVNEYLCGQGVSCVAMRCTRN